MRDEKEERKKQARSNKQTRQSNTAHPRQSLFLEKMSCLRWDSNPRHSHVRTCTYIHVYQDSTAVESTRGLTSLAIIIVYVVCIVSSSLFEECSEMKTEHLFHFVHNQSTFLATTTILTYIYKLSTCTMYVHYHKYGENIHCVCLLTSVQAVSSSLLEVYSKINTELLLSFF